MSYTLGVKLRKGAAWNYLGGGGKAIIQFLAGVVIARILSPSDFGVFFAVTAYTAFLITQVKLGVPFSLLRLDELNELQRSSAFWFMEWVALCCMLLVFFFSPFLADYYDDERYASIMMAMSLVFPVIPFMVVNEALLRRKIDYKTISLIYLKSSLLGTVISVAMAVAGFGPYCFVGGALASSLFSAFLMYRKEPWLPERRFEWNVFRPIMKYGFHLHINNSLFVLTNKVDSMMLGRVLSLDALGIYIRSVSLSRLPLDNICEPLFPLVFSGFSQVKHDRKHTVSMYQKVLCATTLAVYPMLLIFLFAGDAFVFQVYGSKWMPAVVPMKILLVGSFFVTISLMTAKLAEAQNLLGKQTRVEIFNLLMTIVAILIGARWGLNVVAGLLALKMFLTMMLTVMIVRNSGLALGWGQLGYAVLPAVTSTLVAALASYLVAYWLRLSAVDETSLVFMMVISASVLLSYGLAWYVQTRVFRNNPILQASYDILDSMLRRFRSRAGGQA